MSTEAVEPVAFWSFWLNGHSAMGLKPRDRLRSACTASRIVDRQGGGEQVCLTLTRSNATLENCNFFVVEDIKLISFDLDWRIRVCAQTGRHISHALGHDGVRCYQPASQKEAPRPAAAPE